MSGLSVTHFSHRDERYLLFLAVVETDSDGPPTVVSTNQQPDSKC